MICSLIDRLTDFIWWLSGVVVKSSDSSSTPGRCIAK